MSFRCLLYVFRVSDLSVSHCDALLVSFYLSQRHAGVLRLSRPRPKDILLSFARPCTVPKTWRCPKLCPRDTPVSLACPCTVPETWRCPKLCTRDTPVSLACPCTFLKTWRCPKLCPRDTAVSLAWKCRQATDTSVSMDMQKHRLLVP